MTPEEKAVFDAMRQALEDVRAFIMAPQGAEDADDEALQPKYRTALRSVHAALALAKPIS